MIKSFVDSLAAHIDTYWEGMLVYLKDVSGIIGGLCGLAALLYIGSKVWASYARGESIDIHSLLRPFAIGLVCASFNTIVIDGIRGLADPICDYFEGLEANTSEVEQTASFSQAVQDAQKKAAKLQEALDKQQDEDKGFWARLGDRFNFGNFMQNIKNYLFVIFAWAFQFIADLLASLTKFVLLFTRCFSLSVLCLLGPIIFAVSIFPGFKQGLTQWIARFVCIYMWVPLFSVCDIFINTVRSAIANNMLTNITSRLNAVVDMTDNLGAEDIEEIVFQLQGIEANAVIIGSLISILTAVLYKSVPTLASWIIAGGDSSGNLASVAGFAAGASAIAGAGAAALTGMAAKGVASGARQAGGALGAGLAKAGQKISSGGNGGSGGSAAPSAHMGIGPRDMGVGGSTRTPVGFKQGGQGGMTASTTAATANKVHPEAKPATVDAVPMASAASTSPTALWRSMVGGGMEHAGRALRAPHLKHAMRFGNDRQRYAAASDRYASHGILRMAANDINEYVQLAAASHTHASVSTLRRAARYGYASAAGKAAERLLQRGQKAPAGAFVNMPSMVHNAMFNLLYMPDAGQQPTTI